MLLAWLGFACLLLISQISHAAASDDIARGKQVAQIVYGIVSYTRWPAPFPELQLCITGDTRYADALMAGAPNPMHPRITVRQLALHTPEAVAQCQIAYLGTMENGERESLLAQLIGQPVLIISEPPPSCSAGGMFCLLFREDNVYFEVNLDTIARSGLRVHPNVLQLGKRKASP
ncbi:conserved hypothetical protein [Methylovorus glucosotrophus SIP3-4]|uniref:Transmembrane protein n=1 Tax=Methylovorus glucosotrophus (strain SIP3-4) TaxID=582744 RepID=C6X924_METGS|nr:conserved hypothetical protein [Methylovorus glucosotrophus SIP3-4]